MPFARPPLGASGNACTLALDGRAYTLDPCTPDLLNALAYGRLSVIFPGMVTDPAAANALYVRLMTPSDPLDTDDLERIADAYVHTVTGWHLPPAMRLAAALEQSWHVLDGQAASEGVDLLALPAGRALNWIYARAAEGAEYDEADHPGARARMDRDLAAPLDPGEPPAARWEPIDGVEQLQRLSLQPAPAENPPPAEKRRTRRALEPPPGFTAGEQAAAFRSAMATVGAASS